MAGNYRFTFFCFVLFFITWLKNINNQSSNLVETLPNLVGALILRRSDLGLPMDNFRQFLTWLSTWYAIMMCVVLSFYVGFLLLLLLLLYFFVVVVVFVVVFCCCCFVVFLFCFVICIFFITWLKKKHLLIC